MSSYPPRTSAAPVPPRQHAQPTAGQAPGLFGQMASTAAGVAVGSTVGHGMSNMLFGSRGEPAYQEQAPQEMNTGAYNQTQQTGINCDVQGKDFLSCLEKTNDLNSCAYYLEQLKACQAAAQGY
ncbi:hypothetical protein MVES_001760 [Malassezia vespertilionis]|uniref:Mic17p n=1 Tax=Malassezia vespertilionis TaxID=2020962 RepID=A0A2N1JDL3_9BASI|nr:hypothetical protein MVES_001760 [Malassezia vespertilionis]